MALKELLGMVLRGLQFFFAILVIALVGNIIAMGSTPAVIEYTIFAAVLAALSLLYQIPTSLSKLSGFAIPIVFLVLDVLNTLFWFCAAIALAAKIGTTSCGNDEFVNSNDITRHASDEHGACREAKAACAFLWFGWAAFVGSLFLSALGLGGGSAPSKFNRRGLPAMSQV